MPVKVSDASVLAAIAFGEPRADEAAALLHDASLHEPTLLAYELTSVAHKKALLYPDRVDAIARALELALGLEIRWVEVDHRAVFNLALDKALTIYDATYLYVARAWGHRPRDAPQWRLGPYPASTPCPISRSRRFSSGSLR